MKPKKVIISGGGTGGHIFPALSIAQALKDCLPEVEILFVGAEGRMEMERVPAAGYPIVGLPVEGFPRKLGLKTFTFFIKLIKSLNKAKKVVKDFNPDIVVGVGGYASGPLLQVASKKGIPALIQEQNSFPGITNKLLASKAQKICVAYENMDRFFPAEKIVLTGNPIRQSLLEGLEKKQEALSNFNLDPQKPTLLIIGGSLGARTINNSIINQLETLKEAPIQVIWQTGRFYIEEARQALQASGASNIYITDFISHMDLAFGAADLVISRAGAGTISELCLLGKPVILVPSPNVAEDHQTKNAMALVSKKAAVLVPDNQATEVLIPKALSLIQNKEQLKSLQDNILSLAQKDSANRIVDEIFKLVTKH